MTIHKVMVNAKNEKDILGIMKVAFDYYGNGRVVRALICDNILYMVIED